MRHQTQEHKENIAASLRGKKHTEVRKENISKGVKKAIQDKKERPSELLPVVSSLKTFHTDLQGRTTQEKEQNWESDWETIKEQLKTQPFLVKKLWPKYSWKPNNNPVRKYLNSLRYFFGQPTNLLVPIRRADELSELQLATIYSTKDPEATIIGVGKFEAGKKIYKNMIRTSPFKTTIQHQLEKLQLKKGRPKLKENNKTIQEATIDCPEKKKPIDSTESMLKHNSVEQLVPKTQKEYQGLDHKIVPLLDNNNGGAAIELSTMVVSKKKPDILKVLQPNAASSVVAYWGGFANDHLIARLKELSPVAQRKVLSNILKQQHLEPSESDLNAIYEAIHNDL